MDTGLSDFELFEGRGADVSDCAVTTEGVVVSLDVLEYLGAQLLARFLAHAMGQFHFECMEERLSAAVVVAVCAPAHGAPQFIASNESLIGTRAVLASTVTVDDDARRAFAPP